ncbi:hypothetical protein [Leptospirillum ferrooxidans]|uniref:hypothetical protein n=1 Tax=Leptospirillum ferrooxidans TaxID=180 RepID=UPI0005A15772|nr:hypothetical protein [Leptospirillum ferrooxidans]
MKIVPFQKKPDRSFLIKIPALFLAVLATFSACSGSNNTSSTPIPLPNGQAGSLITANGNLADCFAITSTSSLTLCTSSTSSAAGSEGVTALNTFVSSSSLPVLVVGANNGAVNVVPNVDSTSSSPIPCTTSSSPTYAISAVAGVATSSGANIFAASGNMLYGFTYSSSSCNAFSSNSSISISSGTITGLGIVNNVLFGVTSSGSYFAISGANALTGFSSFTTQLTTLPNYPVSGPIIKGMAIDPNGLVFFADASTNTANNGGQITIYHVSSSNPNTLSPNNVQSYSGNNNGVAMSDPIGIAVSETTITNSNYCSTAPCDYIYLLNIGNSIQQYVMPVPTPINGGVSINPFNLPYTGCEMTDPVALTSFPALNQSPFSTQSQTGPFVFLGNKSLSSLGPCSGATNSNYGNNVVSYGITGQ